MIALITHGSSGARRTAAFSGIYMPSALSGSGSTQIRQPTNLSAQVTPIRVSKEGTTTRLRAHGLWPRRFFLQARVS